ncbi:MAG: hypothetical protein ACOXZK_04510 [Bacteroidales bacterium]
MNKVEDLIKKSLKELRKVYKGETDRKSKLLFPNYRKGNYIRISEQEPRFLLVREIENQRDFYYSVETPTREAYAKFNTKKPIKGKGRSGNIDLTLYRKEDSTFALKHLIEFKNTPSASCKKDFLKLLYDENKLKNYYINIIENCDAGTIKKLKEKYKSSLKDLKAEIEEPSSSDLTIIVYVLGNIGKNAIEKHKKMGIDENQVLIKYRVNWDLDQENEDYPLELCK